MTMSIYEDKNYFTTETELSAKHYTLNDTKNVPQSPSRKTSKRTVNIKKEINKFNSKITIIKNNKKKYDKADFDKEFAKLNSININSSTNFFKKAFDNKQLLKNKYNPTSFRSTKNINKSSLKDHQLEFTTRPKMIQEYKIPSAFRTVSTFLPHTATTIYSVLKKKQKEFVSSLEKNRKEKFLDLSVEKSRDDLKKVVLKNKIIINFPDRKVLDERPVLFPVAKINKTDFFSYSQKKRFEKSLQELVNLKYLVENDSKHEDKHIIKFLIKHGVIDKEEIESEKLINFVRFLSQMETIDKTKSLKENCLLALNNENYDPLQTSSVELKHSLTVNNFPKRNITRDKKTQKTKEPQTFIYIKKELT